MNGVTGDTPFLLIWIGFMLLMIVTIGLIFFWGIRARQFDNQDRARYLALKSGIPPEDEMLD